MKPSFLESPSVAWWETSAVRRRDSCDESESPPVAGLGDLDRSVEVNAFDLGFLIGVGDTDGAIVEGSDFDGDDIVNSNDLGLLSGALVSCRMKDRPSGRGCGHSPIDISQQVGGGPRFTSQGLGCRNGWGVGDVAIQNDVRVRVLQRFTDVEPWIRAHARG